MTQINYRGITFRKGVKIDLLKKIIPGFYFNWYKGPNDTETYYYFMLLVHDPNDINIWTCHYRLFNNKTQKIINFEDNFEFDENNPGGDWYKAVNLSDLLHKL